jgi:hypothetical protein
MGALGDTDYYEVCVRPFDKEIHVVFVGRKWAMEKMRNIYIREISPMVRANAGRYMSWEERNVDNISLSLNFYSWSWGKEEGEV